MSKWHQMSKEDVLIDLGTNLETGLEIEEAHQRQLKYGSNELVDRGVKSPWKILWEQLTGIMVVILIISAAVSLLLHEYTDAIVILIIVVINAILGFTQEYRAEKAMAALKKMAVPHVHVRRDGHLVEIRAQELVPGDIVLLEAGNSIPADGNIIESINLRLQESVLTGESEAVEKNDKVIANENAALGDQRNRAFMGTIVTYGRGTMVVTDTGMNTELGKIADMIQSVGDEQTPLQRRLDELGKGLAIAAAAIVAVVFLLGILRGESARVMFMTAISMAVAAVPEGLPAVVTIALAMGAQRMLSRNALIRKLPAVETLGSVTVICSDKTGTLTENRMTVTMLDVAGNRLDVTETWKALSAQVTPQDVLNPLLVENSAVGLLLMSGTLCNDALLEVNSEVEGSFTAVGDPTEGALVVAAARAGLWKQELEKALPRVAELPFDSDRKRMTTIHAIHSAELPATIKDIWQKSPFPSETTFVAFTKGSVDGLLEISDRVWVNGKIEVLNDAWKLRIQDANNDLAQKGMRVLGVAFNQRTNPKLDDPNQPLEQGLVFIGMSAMIDPARPEVKASVEKAHTAGIRTLMITGDHPLTAVYIARELGITANDKVITGAELAKMDLETLKNRVDEVTVFARVSPEHKLKIVQALQEKGHIVAMTGDGVNDAPALKKADIGVAMGITGTDVSKEAADMVLLDDNFTTIVAAVEEGRRIYDNIRKFIKYTMTSNFGEIIVMLVGPFVGLGLPLLPLQILWVNLVTDGLPGLALTMEPAERNTMQRKPHNPQENIFGRGMGWSILWIGLLMGLVSLGIGIWGHRGDHAATWQTMLFTTLTLSQMGNAMATRSESESLFKIGLLSNKSMLGAVLLTFVLQLAVIYVPFLQDIFNTQALSWMELGISLVFSLIVFFAIEAVKRYSNRKQTSRS